LRAKIPESTKPLTVGWLASYPESLHVFPPSVVVASLKIRRK